MDDATRLAHKLQKAWLELVSVKDDKSAVALGRVVDALFEGDPRRAIRMAAMGNLDPRIRDSIREANGLTTE